MGSVLPRVRPRLPASAAVAVVVALGLTWRSITSGDVAKLGGDALYALMVLAVVVLVSPRVRLLIAGAVTCGICWAVEFLQLTPLPADLSARSGLARLALGSTFHGEDLLAYVVGTGLGLGVIHLGRTWSR